MSLFHNIEQSASKKKNITTYCIHSVRGTVGTFLVLFCNVGVLAAFILGTYLPCRIVAWILSTLPLAYLCGVIFVPESPQYLASKNDVKVSTTYTG